MDDLSLSITTLRRWSCQDRPLPPVGQIRAIHIYDFDNTLFRSPLPNKALWNQGTIGSLMGQEFLYGGGWWHNPAILAATGEGIEVEEARGWEGCWNEKIAELVRLSMEDEQALTVLLTGRSEDRFTDLISRMVASKGLSFDMVCLKPSSAPDGRVFGSTMLFKQALLRDIVFTYTGADEVRIYEDRTKHVDAFRSYFFELNDVLQNSPATSSLRRPFNTEVIYVQEADAIMDPATEIAEIQKMINASNEAVRTELAPPSQRPYRIKRSVFYTGYLLTPQTTGRLKSLITLPPIVPAHELRHLANNILITPRPAQHSILAKVRGIGAKQRWRVTGVADYDSRVWAARVAPIPANAKIYTENPVPIVVLATRRAAKPIEAGRIRDWQPVSADQAFEFNSVVGEKVSLRIEEEVRGEDAYEASFPNGKNARKHSRGEEDFPPLGAQPPPQQRAGHGNASGSGNGVSKMPRLQGRGGGGGVGFTRGGAARGGRGNAGGRFPQQNRSGRGRGGGGGGRGGGSTGNRGGGDGGGGRGTRGAYRSLDDNVGQGYGGGGMQY